MSEGHVSERNSEISPQCFFQGRGLVIACRVMEEELRQITQQIPNPPAIEWVEQGLHNDPPRLQRELQAIVDKADQSGEFAFIALAYGLCSRGTEGLGSQRVPLVVPRSHDCIALLLGSREEHEKYLAENPGTYWYSAGWNRCHTPPGQDRYEKLLNEYKQKYGDDNAEYLMEMEQEWFRTYNRATYIDTHTGEDDEQAAYTKQCADWLDWQFDRLQGDQSWMRDLLTSPWDEQRFVVVQPGQKTKAVADERILCAVTIEGTQPSEDEKK